MESEEFWNDRKRFSHNAGKLLGVPIRIHYSIYLTLLLFGLYRILESVDYSNPLPDLLNGSIFLFFLVSIFISILMHEIGHASVAVILKRRVHGIIIYPFLGATVFKQSKYLSPGNNILVFMAGSVTNFTVAGILLYLSNSDFTNAVAEANISIGCLNLVPLFPLDGGRILKSILTLKGCGNARINRIVLNSSRLSAVGIGAVSLKSGDYVLFAFTIFLILIAHVEFSKSDNNTKIREIIK